MLHTKTAYPLKWTEHIRVLGIPEFPSFLVIGKNQCALVEAGASALIPKVQKDLEALGLSVPLRFLLASHAHADHVCGLIRLKHLYPESILAGSAETARILKKDNILQNFKREDRAYAQYLADQGFIDDPATTLAEDPVEMDRTYADNACIDLGDVQIRWIEAPGHAPGNTVFRIDPDNAVLISDSAGYANSETDMLPLFFHHFGHFVSSLEKIKSFNADYLGLGHNVLVNDRDLSLAFLERAIWKARQLRDELIESSRNKAEARRFTERMTLQMLGYGLFKSFSQEARDSFSRLLFRRAMESVD